MGVATEKSSAGFAKAALRLFRRSGTSTTTTISKDNNNNSSKRVSFRLEQNQVYPYDGVETAQERALYYPDLTERQVLLEHRRVIMSAFVPGAASFKQAVEKVYTDARQSYKEAELSSGEFSLASAAHDEEIYQLVASEIRGLEELYCPVIQEHRTWAVKRVVQSQRDKALRKQLPEIAASVSTRSKNFARLIALGDEVQAS